MTKFNLEKIRVCHCDGYETHIFGKKNLEVHWRKFKYRFKIVKDRRIVKAWDTVINLQKELEKYVAI